MSNCGRVATVVAVLGWFAGPASAVSYTGSLSVGNGLVATGPWNDPATSITWIVDDSPAAPGVWRYEYTLNVKGPGDISHFIVELSPGLDESDILALDSDPSNWIDEIEVDEFHPGPGSPLMPGNVYGLKLDADEDATAVTVWFELDREPVWGDVYAKDGKPQGGDWATLWNTGFVLPDPLAPPDSPFVTDHILRPDTEGGGQPPPLPVPEPLAGAILALLVGGGTVLRRIRR